MNVAPCIRSSGGRVVALSQDFTRLRVRLELSWLTRNLVGTIYGGSMYSAIDPFYMLILIRILGRDYIVWDKACTIRFKRPARETLFADFHINDQMLTQVRARPGKTPWVSPTNRLFTLMQSKTIFAPRRQSQKANL